VRRRRAARALAFGLALLAAHGVAGQAPAETFTGTASVQKGPTRASTTFSVTITRYASESERVAVAQALRSGGAAALRKALSAMADAGVIQLGELKTSIKYAGVRPTGSGRLVTVVAERPMLFVGAGVPNAAPRDGHDMAVAMLELKDGEPGTGELVPAAKVGVDDGGALIVENYGPSVVWLKNLAAAR
jgi:hypothetical protein